MRLAISLYGLVGNLVGKSGYNNNGRLKSLELGFKHWNDYFIKKYNADVFIHSWEQDISREILDLYKPKRAFFEQQVVFEIPDYVQGHSKRCQNVYSRWYSQMKSNSLISSKYDFVISSRFDIGWQKTIPFDEINKDVFYYPGGIENKRKILDYWFLSNQKNMSKFCNLFSKLDEYNKPGKKDKTCSLNKVLGISPHRLAKFHLNKLKINHEPLLWQNHWADQADSDFPVLRNIYSI